MTLAYHLVPEPVFTTQSADQSYIPEAFDADGFVHLTHGLEAVLSVGNAFYKVDPRPYLLLAVDLNRIDPAVDVRYEDSGCQYPHVYGPINREAIVAVQRLVRDRDGRFTGVSTAESSQNRASGNNRE